MTKQRSSPPEETPPPGAQPHAKSLRERPAPTAGKPAEPRDADLERLRHELGVHQVELESQNEQLRATQAALAAALDRYRDLYQDAPVGYVTLDLGGVILETNRLAQSLIAAPEPVGRRIGEFISDEDRARFHQGIRQLVTREALPIELRLNRPGGDPRWVIAQMTLALDDAQRPQCRAALIDVTERVRMQEDVAQLAAIVSSSEDAIIVRDRNGRITAWNAAAEHLFGFEAREMLGRTMDALIPPERKSEYETLLRRIASGDTIAHMETERLKRDGARVSLSMSVSPVRDTAGNVTGHAIIARDISARRRMEQALHERMRRLDMLSQAGQALIMGDQDAGAMRTELFHRLAVAVRADIYLDYALGADGLAMRLLSASGLPDAEIARLREAPPETLCLVAAERKAPLIIERLQSCEIVQAGWFMSQGARCLVAHPLIAHGRFYGVAAFASTSRDRFPQGDLLVAESVCEQVASMLERNRLLEELAASEASLKRVDRMKDDFIATLAHELRNPLAPIRNAVDILRRGGSADPERARWCGDIIDRQVSQMTRLLEDLLDVSRLTRNRIVVHRERMALQTAINQALEATQPLLESLKHRVDVDMPEAPIWLYGDLVRLTQVFANLLNNAAKYSDPGARIGIRVSREESAVRVGVRDTGIGIDPRHLGRIFDMFSQLAPALERSRGGLGIGLSLTRGLVELHGGTIEAFSEGLGRGTEFVVRLPLSAAAGIEAGQEAEAAGSAPGNGRRILVADDNVDAAQSLGTLLGLDGHDVRIAYGGIEAWRIAEQWHPEVAILDIGMHDLNGYELCRRIRSIACEHAPLLIACTGWGQAADRSRALEAGFDHHVIKPVSPEEILKLVSDR